MHIEITVTSSVPKMHTFRKNSVTCKSWHRFCFENDVDVYFLPAKGPKHQTSCIFTFTFTRSAMWLILVARIVAYMTYSQQLNNRLTNQKEREIEYIFKYLSFIKFIWLHTYHYSVWLSGLYVEVPSYRILVLHLNNNNNNNNNKHRENENKLEHPFFTVLHILK